MSVILQVDGLHCLYVGTAHRGQVSAAVDRWPDDIGPEQAALVPLLAAVFLDRWYLFLGSPSDLTRYWLIRSCLDRKDTRQILERYGVLDWVRTWIEARELHRVRSDASLERWIIELGVDARLRSPIQSWLNEPEFFQKARWQASEVRGHHDQSDSARNANVIEFGDQVLDPKMHVPLEHLH
jgi:hypothetical protein